jgi:hypothetical protein
VDRKTWWPVAEDNVPALERMLALGVEGGQQDEKGNTVAHKAFDKYMLSKAMVDFWLKKHPAQLLVANADGKTPVDLIGGSNNKLKPYVQTRLLEIGTSKAPSKSPARPRL